MAAQKLVYQKFRTTENNLQLYNVTTLHYIILCIMQLLTFALLYALLRTNISGCFVLYLVLLCTTCCIVYCV